MFLLTLRKTFSSVDWIYWNSFWSNTDHAGIVPLANNDFCFNDGLFRSIYIISPFRRFLSYTFFAIVPFQVSTGRKNSWNLADFKNWTTFILKFFKYMYTIASLKSFFKSLKICLGIGNRFFLIESLTKKIILIPNLVTPAMSQHSKTLATKIHVIFCFSAKRRFISTKMYFF